MSWRPAWKITLCVLEQLPTRLFIRTGDVDGKPAGGGMLLQVMPAQNAQQDDFDSPGDANRNHQNRRTADFTGKRSVVAFVSRRRGDGFTIRRMWSSNAPARGERCADALKTLPDEEVDSILAEDGEIDMHCDYCGNHYLFNAMDIAEIRNNASPADPQVHYRVSGREDSAGFYDDVMA